MTSLLLGFSAQAAGNVDDSTLVGLDLSNADHAVLLHVVFDSIEAGLPASGRCIWAEEEEAGSDEDDDDTGDDEVDAPCDVRGKAVSAEGVVDGGHDEVCDTTTRITETSSEGIGGTDAVLVEETRHPYLTWDEGTTEDTDEEAVGVEAGGICYTSSTECRDSTSDEADGEGPAGTEEIAEVPGAETNEETVKDCVS